MRAARILGTTETIKALSNKLLTSKKVARFDAKEEPQAWTLAYNFSKLEQSFKEFVDVQLTDW